MTLSVLCTQSVMKEEQSLLNVSLNILSDLALSQKEITLFRVNCTALLGRYKQGS